MNKFKEHLELLNKHMQRHNLLMIIAASIITAVAVFLSIYWEFDPNDINNVVDYTYLGGQIFFAVISAGLTAVLVIARFKKFRTYFLAIVIHIYVLLLVVWGTTLCVLDLRFGYSPMVYLMIFTIVAGLFIVEPLFFGIVLVSSLTTVLAFALKDKAAFFNNAAGVENIINFFVFIGMIVLTALEHFAITINDLRIEKRLIQLTYYDDLTGLLNERSYLEEIEALDRKLESGEVDKFAVILMDLNNIKATNDTYGHRFGCHLIVRCGHTLPEYFTSSKLFHVGGDEFIALVFDKDYDELEKILTHYNDHLAYSIIEYEGVELIFSLAHGVAKYEKGLKYRDVLQKADDSMYSNKKMLKEKYGMKQR